MDVVKFFSIPGAVKSYNDENGVVEAFVSVTGNLDLQNDIIMPGAYKKTLQKAAESGRTIKVLKQHDRDAWLGKTVDGEEYPPGSRQLPPYLLAQGYGGLFVKGEFTMEDPAAAAVYAHLKKGVVDEFSVGFQIGKNDDGEPDCTWDEDTDIRRIKTIDPLKEWSPVLWGANPLTSPVSVKEFEDAYGEWLEVTEEQKFDIYYTEVLGEDSEERPDAALSLKAKWTRSFINRLPDSAFAVILPGGKKDATGRTVPRSLRKLPHHGTGGGVDRPHLRNALSRAAQQPALKQAIPHLRRHARSAGIATSAAPDDIAARSKLYVPELSSYDVALIGATAAAVYYRRLRQLQQIA